MQLRWLRPAHRYYQWFTNLFLITLNNAAVALLDVNDFYCRAVPMGGTGVAFLFRRVSVRARNTDDSGEKGGGVWGLGPLVVIIMGQLRMNW